MSEDRTAPPHSRRSGRLHPVPRQVIPGGIPAEIEHAVAAVATPLRVALLRALSTKGPRSANALAECLGAGARVVVTNLAALENTGAVVADRAPGARHGRQVIYAIDPARVDELTVVLRDYIRGRLLTS